MSRRKPNSRISIQNDLLDLSMSELTEIPVKDIALYPKATRMDLSSNRIASINPSFCNFRQIVELDLSQNELETLPENFGNFTNLTKLELYNNQLRTLPVSLGNLTKLRYLDLKNNKFPPNLINIIGECSETKECQQCARQVVSYMQQAQKRLLEEAAQKKKAEEEKEARRQLQELERLKKQKKNAKDKKNAAAAVDKGEKVKQSNSTSAGATATNAVHNVISKKATTVTVPSSNKKRPSLFSYLFKMFLLSLILAASAGSLLLYMYTGGDFTKDKINLALDLLKEDAINLWEKVWFIACSVASSTLKGAEESWSWIQNRGLPTYQWIAEISKSIAADVQEIVYNSICHMMDLFGIPCVGK
ncbi:hypothetical protein CHUAL_000740 [Chamberlinius hualienensis]